MELQKLMEIVEANWPFDEENYPPLQNLQGNANLEARHYFAIRHILMHQQKAFGKLTEICEPLDHGGELDRVVLREVVKKMFVNTLRLATISLVEASDLEDFVKGLAASRAHSSAHSSEKQAGP